MSKVLHQMIKKNTLKKFASDKLTKTQFDEMFQRIVDEKKITYAMRQRDFSGKHDIPDMRKVFYMDLFSQYIGGVKLTDLFPLDPMFAKKENKNEVVIL